ncbi:hypothetical protein C8F01DRAFT_1254261 [Mycena amicta]|nr:hypothetical protein C8F01DRAFT_1254261 [Mycena amicta]
MDYALCPPTAMDYELDSPILPPELERNIFELAGWNDRDTMSRLLLVAGRVYLWIQPLLHRVVRVWDLRQTLNVSKSAHAHIRHLALTIPLPRSTITKTLNLCNNLTALALWTGETYPELLVDMQSLKNLTRLSVDLFNLLGGHRGFEVPTPEQFRKAPFAKLTHLDVFSGTPSARIIPVFSMFPALTHLAFSEDFAPDYIKNVLDTFTFADTRLELVVVVWTEYFGYDYADEEHAIQDARFCMVDCLRAEKHWERDWEEGAWGGRDFWCRAQERLGYLARKRALANDRE